MHLFCISFTLFFPSQNLSVSSPKSEVNVHATNSAIFRYIMNMKSCFSNTSRFPFGLFRRLSKYFWINSSSLQSVYGCRKSSHPLLNSPPPPPTPPPPPPPPSLSLSLSLSLSPRFHENCIRARLPPNKTRIFLLDFFPTISFGPISFPGESLLVRLAEYYYFRSFSGAEGFVIVFEVINGLVA